MQLIKSLINGFSKKNQLHLAWSLDFANLNDTAILKTATNELKKDFSNQITRHEAYVQALLAIDGKIYNVVKRLSKHVHEIETVGSNTESLIVDAVFSYYRQLFLVYYDALQSKELDKATLLPLVLARSMYLATEMIRWRYYSFQSAPVNIWLNMTAIYQIAESHALQYTSVVFYPNVQATALTTLYVNAFILGSLETLSLKKQQIDFVCNILSKWPVKTLVRYNYDVSWHLFYIDPLQNHAARHTSDAISTKSCYYLSLDNIIEKIEQCITLLESDNTSTQADINAVIFHQDALATLKILQREWAKLASFHERRAENRQYFNKPAHVSFGFTGTCDHLRKIEYLKITKKSRYKLDENLKYRYANNQDWITLNKAFNQAAVINQSQKGLSLTLNKPNSSLSSSVGMLIGVSMDENQTTNIGIIRNIKQLTGEEVQIGIEVLSKKSFCLDISVLKQDNLPKTDSCDYNSEAKFSNTEPLYTGDFLNSEPSINAKKLTCLYFPETLPNTQQESLIIPRQLYDKNNTFLVNFFGTETKVTRTKSHEYHKNWVRITFTKEA